MKFPRPQKNKSVSPAKKWWAKFKKKRTWFLATIIIILGLIAATYFFILRNLPLPTRLNNANAPQSTQILDRNQKLLYTIYDVKNQNFVPLSQIPNICRKQQLPSKTKTFITMEP